jgi:uncharacterized RDD family membrane protein YckC
MAPGGPVIASVGRRIGAIILDVILVAIVAGIIGVTAGLEGFKATTTDSGGSYQVTNSGWSAALSLIISALYCIGSWVAMGGTPGQRILGLYVYSASAPKALAVDAAAIRWFLLFGVTYLVGAVAVAAKDAAGLLGLLQLGWIIVLLVTTIQSPMKQGLHDKYAKSVVVKS